MAVGVGVRAMHNLKTCPKDMLCVIYFFHLYFFDESESFISFPHLLFSQSTEGTMYLSSAISIPINIKTNQHTWHVEPEITIATSSKLQE